LHAPPQVRCPYQVRFGVLFPRFNQADGRPSREQRKKLRVFFHPECKSRVEFQPPARILNLDSQTPRTRTCGCATLPSQAASKRYAPFFLFSNSGIPNRRYFAALNIYCRNLSRFLVMPSVARALHGRAATAAPIASHPCGLPFGSAQSATIPATLSGSRPSTSRSKLPH